MKVILTEKVSHLGNIGEIVNVSQGHARNYLIPNRLAVVADDAHKRELEDQQRRLAKKIEAEKSQATDIKKQIDGLTIELIRKVGGSGKLFGTVTNIELSKELKKRDLEIERRIIVIENPIKSLGTFDVKVKLFQDVEATFKVKVDIDPKQAEELKAREEAIRKKKAEDKKKEAAKKEAASEEGTEEGAEEQKAESSEELTQEESEAKVEKPKKAKKESKAKKEKK